MPPTAEVAAPRSAAPLVRDARSIDPQGAQKPVLAETFVGLPWLVRLRWGAIVGQVIALLSARIVLGIDLPWLVMGTIIALTAASNVALSKMPRAAHPKGLIPIVLVVDALGLTAMLFVSGGPANPFSVFFLVHVSLASLLLPERAAWGLVGLTVLAFGSLFLFPPHAHHEHMMHGALGTMHLVGMWVSYALTASFVAYFIGKVSQSLRDRERHLVAVEHLALQNERLTTLTSFSANAAHELATPLATIGLAAKELASHVALGRPADALLSDTTLICAEVARCRKILADISARAGESIGEMPTRTTPTEIMAQVDRSLSREHAARLAVRFESDDVAYARVVVPKDTMAQMLTNLVKNAAEAQEERGLDTPVELTVSLGDRLAFHVLDRGGGLAESVAQRLGQPFVTTKGPAGGLGLGIYLAHRFAERLGGQLCYSRRAGGGVDAELALPLDAIGGRP